MNEVFSGEKQDFVNLFNLNIGQGRTLDDLLIDIAENGECIPTGIKELDDISGGGIRNGLNIIGAATGIGKSTFALDLAENISTNYGQCLYYTNDMTTEICVAKGISRASSSLVKNDALTVTDVLDFPKISDPYRKELFLEAKELFRNNNKNVRFMDGGFGDISVESIISDMKRYYETGIKPIVIIDFLQNLVSDVTGTEKERIDNIVRTLKNISNKAKIPIIALSSVNRRSYNFPITLDSFKESGAIEYASSLLIGIHYKGIGKEDFNIEKLKKQDILTMELVVLKNRLGTADLTMDLLFYPKFNRFPYYPEASGQAETRKKKTTPKVKF